MDLPLFHLSDTWWQEVFKKVKNAVIFIDNTMCECLHWHGGVTKLFNAGALACKELSSFEVTVDCSLNIKTALILY